MFGRRQACCVDSGGRPDDVTATVLEADQRSRDGEVEELLGFDCSYLGRLEVVADVTGRSAGRITCVVPSLESGDKDRSFNLG
jgi:hypothetical protein